MIDGQAVGYSADPNQTLADYLTTWLKDKQLVLKPTTYVRYRDYVTTDLVPALGTIRLDDLGTRLYDRTTTRVRRSSTAVPRA
ncbi:hypothetical protein [Kitasatospora sp. NPDC096204]|uniref:hypothetical protein n=1 Tax=Kitasatospora sp. NPDC096204 TaxID=3364094 RepID=UPI003801BD00